MMAIVALGAKFSAVGSKHRGGRPLITSRPYVRAQHELARKTARFKPAMRRGDLVERDPLGNTRPDNAGGQQSEKPLQILPRTKLGGVPASG
jgi:hypothetical protein